MAKVQGHHSDTKVISATKNREIDPSPRTPFGYAPWAEAVVPADEFYTYQYGVALLNSGLV